MLNHDAEKRVDADAKGGNVELGINVAFSWKERGVQSGQGKDKGVMETQQQPSGCIKAIILAGERKKTLCRAWDLLLL